MLCHTGNFAKINHIFVSLFSLHIVRIIHSYGVGEIYQWDLLWTEFERKKKLTEEKGKGKKINWDWCRKDWCFCLHYYCLCKHLSFNRLGKV